LTKEIVEIGGVPNTGLDGMGFRGSRVELRRLRRLRSACRAEPGTACFAGGRFKSRRPD